MSRHSGRPPIRTITIPDCASVTFHENPTPLCPHGLFWWESDGDRLSSDLQSKMCHEPGCDSNEYHPHDGESITLREERTFAGRKPLRTLYNDAIGVGGGGVLPPDFEERLRELIQGWVLAWTWTGRDGEPLPLPKDDWDGVGRHLEYAELLWIVEAALYSRDPREGLYVPLAVASGKDSPSG